MRDTKIADDCLSENKAEIHFDGETWSTHLVPGIKWDTVVLKPQVGGMQTSSFSADDPPPFHDWGPGSKGGESAQVTSRRKARCRAG